MLISSITYNPMMSNVKKNDKNSTQLKKDKKVFGLQKMFLILVISLKLIALYFLRVVQAYDEMIKSYTFFVKRAFEARLKLDTNVVMASFNKYQSEVKYEVLSAIDKGNMDEAYIQLVTCIKTLWLHYLTAMPNQIWFINKCLTNWSPFDLWFSSKLFPIIVYYSKEVIILYANLSSGILTYTIGIVFIYSIYKLLKS